MTPEKGTHLVCSCAPFFLLLYVYWLTSVYSLPLRETRAIFFTPLLTSVKEKKYKKTEHFLDFLKCVTVSESSKPWKLLIHHKLSSLAPLLWPWAGNSITDVLQQQRLNNYREEMREFDTQHDKLDVACMDGCKHCMSFESRCAHRADFAWRTITVCTRVMMSKN